MLPDKTCYTCLSAEKVDLVDLYKKDIDNISYKQKLTMCLPNSLHVLKAMKICKSCIKQLKVTYDFIKMVKAAQELIKVKKVTDNRIIANKVNFIKNATKDENSVNVKQELYESDNHYYIFETSNDDEQHELYTKCDKCGLYVDDSVDHTCKIKEIKEELIIKYEDVNELNDFRGDILDKVTKKVRNKTTKPNNTTVYECQYCAQAFHKRWQLTKHTRVHLQPKKHICTYCNTGFKESFHLREHLTKHTGERNFACPICDKTFVRKSSQRRHMKSHDAPPGQKSKRTPFLCTICGKRFPFSNGVQRHMRIHLGIKKHECQLCNRRFTQSTHLLVHMRTHTGEKPYICDICGEAFSLNASLQKHMTVHQTEVKVESVQVESKAKDALQS